MSDGINFSNLATVSLTITPVNDAPVIAPIASQTVEQGKSLMFTVVATDSDLPVQTVTYSLISPPAGASIDLTTGIFTWVVPGNQPVGSYTITIRATDNGTPALFGERTVTVQVTPVVNVAPVFAPIGPKTVNELTELRVTISATDADVPAQLLTFSASGLPAGATFDVTTHEFVWTPTEAQGPGSYEVTFSVTDGIATVSEAVTITVADVNLAPV